MIGQPESPPQYRRRIAKGENQAFLGQRGEVYSFTTVYEPPAGFEEVSPYVNLLVKFPDGKVRTFMGAYGEKFKIGDKVECFVGKFPASERGTISYHIKVRHPIKSIPANS